MQKEASDDYMKQDSFLCLMWMELKTAMLVFHYLIYRVSWTYKVENKL